MSTYMFLFCKDCKQKADFTSGSSWLGNAPQSVLDFMGKHASHSIGIFSEHNDILWGGKDTSQEPCQPDPLVSAIVNHLDKNPNSPLAEITALFRTRFHKTLRKNRR